ncbi:MAG: hypothetical protein ACJ8CH_04600 [Microvirga sp.]
MEHIPAWLGIPLLVLIVGFIVFAFRQGLKVRRPPEGVPPERIGPNL